MFNYKKLLGNSFIFAIGTIGSKLINFLLIPLYTHYLSTSEYGIVDGVMIAVNILLPIISLNIFEATLRYGLDKNYNQKDVFTNSFVISTIGAIIVFLVMPFFFMIGISKKIIIFIVIISVLQVFQSLISQFSRAIGNIKVFAINGVILTFITGLMNILLLGKLKMGIDGYLFATSVGLIISIVYLSFSIKINRFLDFKNLKINIITTMLKFSSPLIPNVLNLWVMNASSRFFILFYLTTGDNGLFAVASKVPALIGILSSIFFQAWQLSAIEEYETENKSEVFSEVFYYFSIVMFIGISAIMLVLKPLMKIFVAVEYFSAWSIVPFLLLGTVFSTFSSFLGTNYTAAKETKGVFKTTSLGALANIILNVLFIPTLGVVGAAFSNAISNLLIWIYRIIDTKKYVEIKINKLNLFINLSIIIIQIFFVYLLNAKLNDIAQISLFILILFNNRKAFKRVSNVIKTKKI